MTAAGECREKLKNQNHDSKMEPFSSDTAFDALFPIYIQELSVLHFTPLEVAITAAHFLAPDENARVIDIGAGIGKFCMAGSHFTKGRFTGIEQRQRFVHIGNKVIKRLDIDRVELRYGNFTDIEILGYTGIYFYNSFHENLVFSDALDKKVTFSAELYELYTAHFLKQLNAMPPGTRLATYWLGITEIPGSYQLLKTHFDDKLKLWVKTV
jgi:hypothetical protein